MIPRPLTHGQRSDASRVLPVMLSVAASALIFGSCSQDNGAYPNVITQFADIHTSSTGRLHEMVLDNGQHYIISNNDIQSHRPDTVYRAVVGFLPEDATASSPAQAFIVNLAGARVLGDSTGVVRRDPTDVASMWFSGPYVNMQFTALSQGGTQYWGFAIDGCREAGEDGRQHSRHYLSIHHSQGTDPKTYSRTYYSSLPLSSIPQYSVGDTITITVQTFQGPKSWDFCEKE